ncbi:DUF6461 domain-containing protein [Streptomyces sp. NPDC005811]|uniref:DUF6461 domain-containing protein n=1 Tax=Streptomyces sp. NPDC005811 TaxID=3154565 RepID=UPI003406D8A1
MTDGIVWLVDDSGWTSGVVFARGISPEELAVRMGGAPGGATEPITHADVSELEMEIYRPGADGDGVIRVGRSGEWSFALEYGDSTGSDLLEEISTDGVEAVHYVPPMEHPPATFRYAHDGVFLTGYGLTEEIWRWGQEPDLLLPDLVAAGLLSADGKTYLPPEDEHYKTRYRRSLGVVERRFGLSLCPAFLRDARLPAYAVRGEPDMDLSR